MINNLTTTYHTTSSNDCCCSPYNSGRFALEAGWNNLSAAGELRPVGVAECAYTHRKAQVEQLPLDQLSPAEMLWKLQGFPVDAMPVQDGGGAVIAAERAHTRVASIVARALSA